MNRIELLSPSGNMESLKAAIMAGADAVYLGGKNFGARAFANNFSDEELIEAINYAHLYGVKIYVTVNTLIYDNEVNKFLEYIEFLHKNNVDAVIMQDIGMIDLVRKTYPNLEIHASTQMHIHNLEGVKLLEKLGVKRVVLGREVSIDTIKEIKKHTNIEIEVFIHGALCISYSGQCLMSSLTKHRSGNRGECAGNCRLKYDLLDLNNQKLNKDEYLLSTKDLCTLEYINELIDVGVTSLKIEGRMKREEYVYLVTSIYRKNIDNYLNGTNSFSENDITELKKIYNRSFTKGYLFNEENSNIVHQTRPNHMGIKIGKVVNVNDKYMTIKLEEDLNQNDGIRILSKEDTGFIVNYIYKDKKLVNKALKGDTISLPIKEEVYINDIVVKTTDTNQIKKIENNIKNLKRKVLINGKVKIKTNQNIILTINDGKNNIEVVSDFIVDKAINKPITKEDVIKQLSKLGDTIYEFSNINVDIDNDAFVVVSKLNELRRLIVERLNSERLYTIPFKKEQYAIEVPDFKIEKNKNILIDNEEQYKKADNSYKYVFIENEELFNQIVDNRKILKIPRVVNKFLNKENILLVGELGSVNYYKNVFTDFSLNVTNSYSVAFLHNLGVKMITLSYEMTFDDIDNLLKNYEERYHKHPNLEVIVYGNEELMISKFNLPKMYGIEKGYLRDLLGNMYLVKSYKEYMKIYNSKARVDEHNYFELGVNNIRYNIL